MMHGRRFKSATAVALVATSFISGCVHSPRRSPQMEADLLWLEQQGYSDDEVDYPTSAAVALILDIFPIPGIGHFYVGDWGDGIKTSLMFWLIVPWIKGPIDAFREARYQNDMAWLEYAEDQGWFEERDNARERAEQEAEARAEAREERRRGGARGDDDRGSSRVASTGDDRDASDAAFCAGCGARFKGPNEAFCAGCGKKR